MQSVYDKAKNRVGVNKMSISFKWLFPTIIAPEDPLTPDELTWLDYALELYLKQNPVLKRAFTFAVCFVNILPIFSTGRTLRLNGLEKRQDYLNRLHRSRSALCRSAALLVGLPVKMIYYSQEVEQEKLGFNARSLKEEANLRIISRKKDCPAEA